MKLFKRRTFWELYFVTAFWTARALAQSTTSSSACPTFSPTYPAPVVASGWQAQLIVTGLSSPRSMLFDTNGHLLVVQAGQGVINLELADSGGLCVSVSHMTYMINSTDVSIYSSLLKIHFSFAPLVNQGPLRDDSIS
jgi:glucose/arabinose dehydrogenase